MNNKSAVAVLAVVILVMAGCAVVLVKNSNPAEKWYNVDIIDNVYPQYTDQEAKENFYAYANNELYRNAQSAADRDTAFKIIQKDSVTYSASEGIIKDITYMFNDILENPEKIEGEDVQALFEYLILAFDEETRKEDGIEPLRKYVAEIDSISTIDQMTDFIVSGGGAYLYEAFFYQGQGTDEDNGDRVIELGSGGLPSLDRNQEKVPDEDAQKKYRTYEGMLSLFTEIDGGKYLDALRQIDGTVVGGLSGERSGVMDYTDLGDYTFPCQDFVGDYYEEGIDHYRFQDSGWIDTLDRTYTGENLMQFKSMAMYTLMIDGAYHLNAEAYQTTGEDPGQFMGGTLVNDSDGQQAMLIGKYYARYYNQAEINQLLRDLTDQCKDAAKQYFRNIDWISQGTKDKICDKIDRMIVRAGSPDGELFTQYDYRDAEFDENTNLVDFMAQLRSVNYWSDVWMSTLDYSDMWPRTVGPQTFNMYYMPAENSINLLFGYAREFLKQIDGQVRDNMEYVYGTIAAAICHEITHGFDDDGQDYTPEGTYEKGWLFTEDEKRTFDKRVDRLKSYITGFYVGNGHYLQKDMVGEVMADMGGASMAYRLLTGTMDRDKFFRALVKLEFNISSEADYYDDLSDPHPPGMYRVNMELQQMQAFFDYYGITDGGMYLAPGDRVNVW